MATITRDLKERKDVKDREKEPKRRRAIALKSDGITSPTITGPSEAKKAKTDAKHVPSKGMFYQEEEEIERRPLERDQKVHKETCDNLRRTMAEIKVLRESGKASAEQLEEKRIYGTTQFVILKKLNRLAHIRCKKGRDETNEAKQKIDQHHLQLQNLLYEVMHLQKEITKCLEFKSKDEDINLISVEDFYREAPVEIAKPETKRDTHQQTLARLDWELQQRVRLSEKLTEAQTSKKTIAGEIKSQRDYLESLQPMLNNILGATKPVQEYLGMPFDEIREQHRTSRYLPRPLYVLYMQAAAYHEACDKKLAVSIQGDVEVARAVDASASDVDEDSDSDQEEMEKQKTKRRRLGSGDRRQQKKQKIMKKHPLSVVVDINSKEGYTLTLTFYYIVALGIVTVTVKLSSVSDIAYTSISGGNLLSPDSLLSCILPGDHGNETPNPSNEFMLSKLGLGEFSQYIPELGHPYQWVQQICGLQFINMSGLDQPTPASSGGDMKVQASLSASCMENTITKLRARVRARLALQKQLATLERLTIPVCAESQHQFPAKLSARLKEWKRSTYEDFVAVPYTDTLVKAGLAGDNDMFFTGIMERGSAKLVFHLVVGADYPESTPVFAVSIMWKTERTCLNDEHVRDLDAELNIYCDELVQAKTRDQLLANQLQRLAMCFDVYLETESENSALEGPVEFAKEKIFPRLTRGPQRSRPYKYNSQLGFFSQR